jgi:multicomponent Na+:H+ antiporter subunit B
MIIDFLLLLFLVICAMVAIYLKDLLSAIMILCVYSLVMAIVWARLNAVDVSITEAAVGAGITTVLLIAALSRTKRGEEDREQKIEDRGQKTDRAHSFFALLIVIVTGAVLVYGTLDMPDFGDPEAPATVHVSPRYIEKSYEETGVINFVTAVLASYRGFDTLGEVTVIFTAGMCVILLLRRGVNQ